MDLQKLLFIIESILDFLKGNLFMICYYSNLQKIEKNSFFVLFTVFNKKNSYKIFKKCNIYEIS